MKKSCSLASPAQFLVLKLGLQCQYLLLLACDGIQSSPTLVQQVHCPPRDQNL
jgi:hypothetical protein